MILYDYYRKRKSVLFRSRANLQDIPNHSTPKGWFNIAMFRSQRVVPMSSVVPPPKKSSNSSMKNHPPASLCDIIDTMAIIYNATFQKKNTNILTKEELRLLYRIVDESSETFRRIDHTISEISKDDPFDIHTIPQIVLVLYEILWQYHHHEFTLEVIFHLVKYLMVTILESSVLPLPHYEKSVANKLVDVAMELLTLHHVHKIVPKAETGCIWCMPKMV